MHGLTRRAADWKSALQESLTCGAPFQNAPLTKGHSGQYDRQAEEHRPVSSSLSEEWVRVNEEAVLPLTHLQVWKLAASMRCDSVRESHEGWRDDFLHGWHVQSFYGIHYDSTDKHQSSTPWLTGAAWPAHINHGCQLEAPGRSG